MAVRQLIGQNKCFNLFSYNFRANYLRNNAIR